MSVSRTIKPLSKVRVTAFEATVIGYDDNHSTIEVEDDRGYRHYLYMNQLDKIADPPPPFRDGERYVDSDGDVLVYTATGYMGGPGWVDKESTEGPRAFSWAARPLREYTRAISEDGYDNEED